MKVFMTTLLLVFVAGAVWAEDPVSYVYIDQRDLTPYSFQGVGDFELRTLDGKPTNDPDAYHPILVGITAAMIGKKVAFYKWLAPITLKAGKVYRAVFDQNSHDFTFVEIGKASDIKDKLASNSCIFADDLWEGLILTATNERAPLVKFTKKPSLVFFPPGNYTRMFYSDYDEKRDFFEDVDKWQTPTRVFKVGTIYAKDNNSDLVTVKQAMLVPVGSP